MKKLLLISILLGSIILAGCSQKGLSQDELFSKKQECKNYEKEISNSLSSSNSLLEIFYSTTENTCIYVTLNYGYKTIYNHLTNNIIIHQTEGNSKEFDKKLKELKGK